jgi:hypothetical protein
MAQTIPLKLLIELGGGSEFFDSVADSDQDIVHPWPGDPVTFDLTVEPQLIQPVWIGVSADGSDAQAYPLTTSVAAILAAGWAHVYQGTEIADGSGTVTVYSNQYNHVLLAIASCCNNNFATQALALKNSPYALIPGQTYPCPASASYKWIALKGKNETRPNLAYTFGLSLINQDLTLLLNNTTIASGALPNTTQLELSWPEDFIGLIIDGVTLVGNDTVPLSGERQVKDFDGGIIAMAVNIEDLDVPEGISNANSQFALPDSDCEPAESGFFEDQFETQFE